MKTATKTRGTKDKTFTPMMQQYLSIKARHPDLLILFRLGDFYELFFDDAKLASRELQLYLTGKSAGVEEKVPMCGIPHHAYQTYVQKLLDRGYKVGIVEQLEDPKLAKKLVERDVVQIITPGANLEVKTSDNCFIASLSDEENCYVLSYADLTTGELNVSNIAHSYDDIISEIVDLDCRELVVPTSLDAGLLKIIQESTRLCVSYHNDDSFGLEAEALFKYLKDPRQMKTVARLYNYLKETQKRDLSYFRPAVNRLKAKTLLIDHNSRVNMELTKNIRGEGTYGTLYWLLDHCQTPMGKRLLKQFIDEPSADQTVIEERLDLVTLLLDNFLIRADLGSELAKVYDLDRLIGRVGFDSCSGREMLQLKKSLEAVPAVKTAVQELCSDKLRFVVESLGDFSPLTELLERSVSPDCPLTIKEGGIFKKGYDSHLDELIDMTTDGKSWLSSLEAKEKERTGIRNLRIGYNRIFGYYIEVSTGSLALVKDEFGYIRKQTLTTGERFVTAELQEAEARILHAEEERLEYEYKLFQELRQEVARYTESIQRLSEGLAYLDVLVSLATVSADNSYVRPVFNHERRIEVLEARHPVIEKVLPLKEFVANDYLMDKDTDVLIITGPNMGGKSTYMREFALIVIMAQLGCYVPARKCDLYVFDAIYTRIGAADDLIRGQSTFMVEMSETNKALSKATADSLLLFDEIGRGTATYDGMALAQAILEYLVAHVHAKTIFSTHYHEITKLVSHLKEVRNIHVDVTEKDNKVTFLYKVKPGPMDKSYGINVARLAGLPEELLGRANEILGALEQKKLDYGSVARTIEKKEEKRDELTETVKGVDPLSMSPLEALNFLFELKKKVK